MCYSVSHFYTVCDVCVKMEKLTQFVSKSFENNNNYFTRPAIQHLVNLKTIDKGALMSDEEIKRNENQKDDNSNVSQEETKTVKNEPPAAKNWLISNSPKPQTTSATYGMDLRVSTNGYTTIFGASIQSAPMTVSDVSQSYSEHSDKCENNSKDKLKFFNSVTKTTSSKLCCCPSSLPSAEQEDSVESKLDNMASSKVVSQRISFLTDDEKHSGKIIIQFQNHNAFVV